MDICCICVWIGKYVTFTDIYYSVQSQIMKIQILVETLTFKCENLAVRNTPDRWKKKQSDRTCTNRSSLHYGNIAVLTLTCWNDSLDLKR